MVVGSLAEGGCMVVWKGVVEGGVRGVWVKKKCEGVRVVEQSRHNQCGYQLCLQAILSVEKLHMSPPLFSNSNLFTHNSTQNLIYTHLSNPPRKSHEKLKGSLGVQDCVDCRAAWLCCSYSVAETDVTRQR